MPEFMTTLTLANITHTTHSPNVSHTLYTPVIKSSLILVYSLSILLSVTGNTAAIFVFSKGRRSRTDLRPFLINLALADLVMAIFCIPFTFSTTILEVWVFSSPMCPIVLFLQLLSVTVSVTTNTVIGIDRLWAFALPMRARMSTKNVRCVLAVVWSLSVGLSSVQLVVGRVDLISGMPKCVEKWPEPHKVWKRGYTLFVLFVTYVIPLCVLTITYSIVGRLLWLHRTPGNVHESRDSHNLKSKRKVVKMLVTIVLVFGLCWLPLHTFMLTLDFNPHIYESMRTSPHQANLVTGLFCTVHWLAMANSFANPIIYGFMNESFRADLKYLLCKLCLCCFTERMRRRYTFFASHRAHASSLYVSARDSPTARFNSTKLSTHNELSPIRRHNQSSSSAPVETTVNAQKTNSGGHSPGTTQTSIISRVLRPVEHKTVFNTTSNSIQHKRADSQKNTVASNSTECYGYGSNLNNRDSRTKCKLISREKGSQMPELGRKRRHKPRRVLMVMYKRLCVNGQLNSEPKIDHKLDDGEINLGSLRTTDSKDARSSYVTDNTVGETSATRPS